MVGIVLELKEKLILDNFLILCICYNLYAHKHLIILMS